MKCYEEEEEQEEEVKDMEQRKKWKRIDRENVKKRVKGLTQGEGTKGMREGGREGGEDKGSECKTTEVK